MNDWLNDNFTDGELWTILVVLVVLIITGGYAMSSPQPTLDRGPPPPVYWTPHIGDNDVASQDHPPTN